MPDGQTVISITLIGAGSTSSVGHWKRQAVGCGRTQFTPEDVAGLLQRWQVALATGETFEAEARVRRTEGAYRLLLRRKLPLPGIALAMPGTLTFAGMMKCFFRAYKLQSDR